MAKFEVGMVVGVTANFKAPSLIGTAAVLEVRENEPQDAGGVRTVYRVSIDGKECWVREAHLSAPPAPRCGFCGGPTPCLRSD
jgi:hypothetical protein